MQQLVETPFKVLSCESKKGMVLIIRMKVIYEARERDGVLSVKPREKVYEVLTRKLENLDEILSE
jgi:predicted AlkP superfamily phosphohydrolase/phosphomutase